MRDLFAHLGSLSLTIDAAVPVALLLLFATFLAFRPFLNIVWWMWDEGNNLYPAFALLKGKLPNIDFRCGYPGASVWLLAKLFKRTGVSLAASKALALSFSLITALSAFFLTWHLFPFGLALGACAFFWVVLRSFPVFPTANSGFPMEAFGALGLIATCFGLEALTQGSLPLAQPFLFAAALLFGFSFCFKQSGLFFVLGFFDVLILFCDSTSPDAAFLRRLAFFAVGLLPFLGFLALRLKSMQKRLAPRTVVFLPWAAALLFTARFVFSDRNPAPSALPIWLCLALGLTACLATFAWIFLYPLTRKALGKVFREIFVEAPRLIDRDVPPLACPAVVKRTTAAALLLLLGAVLLAKAPPSAFSAFLSQTVHGPVWFASLFLPLTLALTLWPKLQPAFREIFWTYPLLGGTALLLLALDPAAFDPAAAGLLILCALNVAALYPYSTNAMFATTGFTAMALAYLFVLTRAALTLPVLIGAPLAAFAAAVFFGGAWASRKTLQDARRRASDQGKTEDVSFVSTELPAVWAAAWLKAKAKPEETLDSYPNFALSAVLSGHLVKSFLPNFLGDRQDYETLVQEIEKGEGADYWVISPILYPYEKDHPCFYAPTELLSALSTRYTQVGQLATNTGAKLAVIYRKNKR